MNTLKNAERIGCPDRASEFIYLWDKTFLKNCYPYQTALNLERLNKLTSENTALCLELTQAILERFWHHDISLLTEYMDKDFSFIDSFGHYLLMGHDEVLSALPSILSRLTECNITDKMFAIAQNCGNACTVIGSYLLTPTQGDGSNMMQHCVFVWELSRDGTQELKHVGITRPESTADNSSDDKAASTEQSRRQSDKLVIVDQDECMRFINKNDILYATSDGRNTLIRCTSGDIKARLSISSFTESVGDGFLLIHRCYAVNISHIALLKPYVVVLSDGSEIPVPVKRYSDIKNKLSKLIS